LSSNDQYDKLGIEVRKMARKAREKSESGIYHIMLRGINRQNIFEDDEDKERFIERIKYYKTISEYKVYGYCLMDNHVHLLIKEEKESISNAIKRISSSYVHWYNNKYERCGHLFQERYKSEVVENDEYFLTVLRYIHQNPIKAEKIENIVDYKWSSYKEYIGQGTIIDTDFALRMLSEDRKKSIEEFEKYSKEKNNDECLEYKEKKKITDNEVRENLRKMGIKNISELQKLEKDKRNEIIRRIKGQEGVTIRQISRITGISKSVIHKI
jgi:REP element-mobilizing transposase RayT